MGASSENIRDDDVVADVVGLFTEQLATTCSTAEATRRVVEECADFVGDEDDGPVFWIGLAEAQWTFGRVDPDIVRRVAADFEAGRGLERWSEVSEMAYAKRRAVMMEFLAKIRTPNPSPAKPPKLASHPPIFAAGDCLSVTLEITSPPLVVSPRLAEYIRLAAGRYAAAFVLMADSSSPHVGRNLVATLDWIGDAPPGLDVFRVRKWLHERRQGREFPDVRWYDEYDFKGHERRVQRIGNLPLDPGDRALSAKADSVNARLLSNAGQPYSSGRWQELGTKVPVRKEWDRLHPPGPAELVEGWLFCQTCRNATRAKDGEPHYCPTCDRDLFIVP